MEGGRAMWQRQVDAAMKAVPCPRCGAEIGKYCFRSRTVCSARVDKVFGPSSKTGPAVPGNTKEKSVKDEQELEEKIVAAGKTAPRVTPEHIDACIVSEHYFTAKEGAHAAAHGKAFREYAAFPDSKDLPEALGLLTFCVLVLRNGFTVTGESACASPENFDAEIGRKISRQNAREKIWALEGYALKERLSQGGAR